jgi:hypothetical protein
MLGVTMTNLNSSTVRRLQKIKQSSGIWEGDRRSLPKVPEQDGTNLVHLADRLNNDQPQCILWVDASMGIVRSMDVVDPGTGNEALVRALLKAIEHPQSPAQPSRPQKILVRDRSLQFYLRGVLQSLDITIEHVEHLPLIEEIFTNIIQHTQSSPPSVPAEYAHALYHQADILYRSEPWTYMWDHQVLGIELNQWDLGTIYAVIMGHLGLEQGVIFYRSRESLVRFRELIADQDTEEDDLEETFLRQDCLFALFESTESLSEAEIRTIRGHGYPITNEESSYPIFGTLHPLEGGRPFLYDEEAIAMAVAIASVNMFISQHAKKLEIGDYEVIKGQYQIKLPNSESEQIKVTVKTLPDLEEEIQAIVDEYEDDDEFEEPLIRDDLWPAGVMIKLTAVSWEGIDVWRAATPAANRYLAPKAFAPKGEAMSVLLVQTSRPKALELIKKIKELGYIKGLSFNPASLFGDPCELGLLITGNDYIYMFGEFHDHDAPADIKIRQGWKQRCKDTKGYCAVVIAMGLTGAARGKPEPSHILGYYEVPLVLPKSLGLGTLTAEPDDEDF